MKNTLKGGMRKTFLLVIFLLIAGALTACSNQPEPHSNTQLVSMEPPALSDSAQADCILAGDLSSIARQPGGSSEGVCALPNGKRCNDPALASGGCG